MAGPNGKGNGNGANGDWGQEPQFDDEPPPSGLARGLGGNGRQPAGANGANEDWDYTPLAASNPVELQGQPVPQRRWVVPEWIPWGRVTGLYGHGGEGKTLLCQQLMTACALGQPWLGLQVAPLRTLGFFCEDDLAEMHARQADINRLYQCDFHNLTNMLWLPRLGLDNVLMSFAGDAPRRAPLVDEIIRLATQFGAQLVIVDTVSDTFDGDENNRPQVRKFVQHCLGGIARAINGTVLATAHPSRAGLKDNSGEGGSTQWHNSFRSRSNIIPKTPEDDQPADPKRRILRRMKANYAPRDAEIELLWQDGVFVNASQPTGILATIEKRKAERVFLDILDATSRENQPVSTNSRTGNYAPALFAKRPLEQRENYKKSDFERAMQTLFANRQITNLNLGRPDQQKSRIVRTG